MFPYSADDNADNRVAIAQAGGIPPLIQLLQTGSEEVKMMAAAALRNLAGRLTCSWILSLHSALLLTMTICVFDYKWTPHCSE